MTVDLTPITTALWLAVTVGAFIAGAWLAVTFARLDRHARDVLERQLAAGEIDGEDYRRRITLEG